MWSNPTVVHRATEISIAKNTEERSILTQLGKAF